MQIDKKKIVFSSILLIILVFMIGYYYLMIKTSSVDENLLKQTEVPELEVQKPAFKTKKEAVDALEEKRERNAPSIYNESLLDSTGQYTPNLLDKEKERMVDSIYRLGSIKYSDSLPLMKGKQKVRKKKSVVLVDDDRNTNALKEMALEQQLFFAVSPTIQTAGYTDKIEVEVDGEQTVKVNDRLQMRVIKDVIVNNSLIKKNTIIYGIVKFRPNRVVLEVDNIEHRPVKLLAFDLADGLEGIYIKNSFKGDALNEVLEDAVRDINIPGLPQLNGIKRVFQRNNRNIKVTVNANYKLIIKTKL